MRVSARLQPGVTLDRASAEATGILGKPVRFEDGATGYSSLRRQLSQPLLLVAVVVGLVLLIACANLANLMLAATFSRERELGVRTAIGASRGRIVRQLITESLVLAMAGGALGMGLAYGISAALLGFLPADQAMALPNLRFDLNPKVLTFAIALSCLTCLMFGLLPALRATRRQAAVDLRSRTNPGSRERTWLSRGLLVGQVVLCTALLTLSGVFLHTLQKLRGQDSGYSEEHLLVADVQPPRQVAEAERDRLIEAFRARVATLPSVEAAAFSHVGQLSGSGIEYRIGFPDRPVPEADQPVVFEQRMSPGFLRTMGTLFLSGRDFADSDDEHAPLVTIVNDAFVRRFFPDRNPIGARFFRSGGTNSNDPLEIVGVVKDTKWVNLRDESPAMYYRPYRQMGGSPVVRLVVRTSGEPADLAGQLLPVARGVDPRLTLTNVMPFRDVVNRTLVVERLTANVSTACGLLALVIAAVGLYGVLAYSVVRRRREIGVRIAVGAAPGTVEWMFLRESLTWLAVGLALGLPLAFVATHGVSSMLFGLGSRDPLSVFGAVTALTIATVAAAYVPAHRASRVDPVRALRED
jgi:predicted permease